MNKENLDSAAGAEVYSDKTLRIYDLLVLRFSNTFLWRCSASKALSFFNRNVSANHLDVGVGSGYFLEHGRFPDKTRLVLMDLNETCLDYAKARSVVADVSTAQTDVLEPIEWTDAKFDSINLGYLLHCLPGTMKQKYMVFENLRPLLNDGGILFGSTILGEGQKPNWAARKLMGFYNSKGIFSNAEDNLDDLRSNLETYFRDVTIEVVGEVALFKGRV
ncbi:bifunctional 2-polyprenyl-6-hydroxyphenol methylase/3-demethylubiquinol 3-O-methyltransferase UbiG [Pseudovibrio sp. Ad37]|uniref:class I SAM-dependent methyltransferase n=1 Tax=Pseudovibrio sp. Ad37 TaxID=989422 RepID=UPI0007AEDDB9|nr:class I SAM-dependent methyltransferase [Pseudovibrio sp. Ad37]KZL14734.1 Methyltransferase domain protein [Pseudovibrio sp. Ad37]